jgi:hypothetical protein
MNYHTISVTTTAFIARDDPVLPIAVKSVMTLTSTQRALLARKMDLED